MSGIESLTFDPDAVLITNHALERYLTRRDTDVVAARRGIMRLLTTASMRSAPPLRCSKGRWSRIFVVSGFMLVMDAELTTLISLWRHP